MEIFRIIGIALTGAFLSILIKNLKPEFSMVIPLIVTYSVIFCVLPYLCVVIEKIKDISIGAGIENEYINIIFKILGISYIAAISSELCRDVGESAVASKIELSAKIIIMFLSLPIVTKLLGIVRVIIMR